MYNEDFTPTDNNTPTDSCELTEEMLEQVCGYTPPNYVTPDWLHQKNSQNPLEKH